MLKNNTVFGFFDEFSNCKNKECEEQKLNESIRDLSISTDRKYKVTRKKKNQIRNDKKPMNSTDQARCSEFYSSCYV